MALFVDWGTREVYLDGSITDLPAHHLALRDMEASEEGILHDDIIEWQNLDLGGGAYLPQVDYVNGYSIVFLGPGPFAILGNLNAPIADTGVQVERKTSAAYITTAIGGSGPSAADIAAALLAAAQVTPIYSNVKQVNSVTITGSGVPNTDEWRPA